MVLIIGAGLSGLLIGYRLKTEGIPFKILEARDRVGGRINTLKGTNNTPIEMGATWFMNQHQNLMSLLNELELDYFEQHVDSSVYFESSKNSPIQSIQIPSQASSYRISGGTTHLIDTLLQKLDENDILLNQTVKSIKCNQNTVQVTTKEVFEGKMVVLAVPPKLWSNRIVFEPNLPQDLITVAKETHTWMEDSIKIALIYKSPFWEQENLTSTFYSNAGPITELYDHCNDDRSKYALCGFINSTYNNLTYTERRISVISQLKKVFGVKAEEFIDYEECVWCKEKNTFEVSDTFLYQHKNNGNPIYSKPFFDDKLLISSSESAIEFPGYMEGAVCSANAIFKMIQNTQQRI